MPSRQRQATVSTKKVYDYSGLEPGVCLQAESDGSYYTATVVQVSSAKNRVKAPVKISYRGYEGGYDEWVGGDRLRSKAVKVQAPAKPQKPACLPAQLVTEGEIPIQRYARAYCAKVKDEATALKLDAIVNTTHARLAAARKDGAKGYVKMTRQVCKTEFVYELSVVWQSFDDFKAYNESAFGKEVTGALEDKLKHNIVGNLSGGTRLWDELSFGGSGVVNPLYLGFDVSTQSCKAVVVDNEFNVVCQSRVEYSKDLPDYKTEDGVHRDGNHVTSPTLMWVEALELSLDRLKEQGCPFERIVAISGSGQQHGSVYWSEDAANLLKGMKADQGKLVEQLAKAFATKDSPIWMDSSTTEICQAMEKHVGGKLELSRRTGSAGYERFTAHHIKALAKASPEAYAAASRVSLVSSWGASMLTGRFAAIDASDGAGMNLMDVRTRKWDKDILENFLAEKDTAHAKRLRTLLGTPRDSWDVAGRLHPVYKEKYGFGPAKVVHWSGDNPCAAVGLGLSTAKDIAISLGTSDTAYVVLDGPPPKPLPFGHLFPHPLPPNGNFFTMLCYCNGDIARKRVMRDFGGGSWEQFDKLVSEAPVGNGGQLGIFLVENEITPPLLKGDVVLGRMGSDGKLEDISDFEKPSHNCRAVVEGRALSIKLHLMQLNPKFFDPVKGDAERAPRLLLTGGGSNSKAIRQVFADVFGRAVVVAEVPDSAAVGAAMRAKHGEQSETLGRTAPVPEAVVGNEELVQPRPEHAETYKGLLLAYDELEKKAKSSRALK